MLAGGEGRVGEQVEVLVEAVVEYGVEGRAACQGPEVDGTTTVTGVDAAVAVGDMIVATVVDTEGVDLVAAAAGERIR